MITANMTHSAASQIYRVKTQTVADKFLEVMLLTGSNSLDKYLGEALEFKLFNKDGEFLIVLGKLESRGSGKYAICVLKPVFQA